jgi:hypothetical protein
MDRFWTSMDELKLALLTAWSAKNAPRPLMAENLDYCLIKSAEEL